MAIDATALLEKANALEELAKELRAMALTEEGEFTIERQAIEVLTPKAQEVVSYLVGQGGEATYSQVLKDLKISAKQLGGRLGSFKPLSLAGMPPVVDWEDIEGRKDEWLVRLHATFREAAAEWNAKR